MAEAGAQVACLDLPSADLTDTLARLESTGAKYLSIPCDVTSEDQLAQAVNSAGIANSAPAVEMSREQWQRVYDIDVTGVFLSCQAQGRAMLRNGGGSIVNIASMSGTIANRDLLQVHYNSAKAAVKHFTKSLAVEWAPSNIRVNSISPGYTATPMNLRPEVADSVIKFAADTPMGRMADPMEIASPAVFLLSTAASFCTGVDLLVDGGFCCW